MKYGSFFLVAVSLPTSAIADPLVCDVESYTHDRTGLTVFSELVDVPRADRGC
jgi:hypothetical protein